MTIWWVVSVGSRKLSVGYALSENKSFFILVMVLKFDLTTLVLKCRFISSVNVVLLSSLLMSHHLVQNNQSLIIIFDDYMDFFRNCTNIPLYIKFFIKEK